MERISQIQAIKAGTAPPRGDTGTYGGVESVRTKLQNTNPEALSTAGDAYIAAAGYLEDTYNLLESLAGTMAGDWKDKSSQQAQQALQLLHASARELAARARQVGAAHKDYADELRKAKSHLPESGPYTFDDDMPGWLSGWRTTSASENEMARQHIENLNERIVAVYDTLPLDVTTVLPSPAPPETPDFDTSNFDTSGLNGGGYRPRGSSGYSPSGLNPSDYSGSGGPSGTGMPGSDPNIPSDLSGGGGTGGTGSGGTGSGGTGPGGTGRPGDGSNGVPGNGVPGGGVNDPSNPSGGTGGTGLPGGPNPNDPRSTGLAGLNPSTGLNTPNTSGLNTPNTTGLNTPNTTGLNTPNLNGVTSPNSSGSIIPAGLGTGATGTGAGGSGLGSSYGGGGAGGVTPALATRAAGTPGMGGMPFMPMGGQGNEGNQERERSTWLTEDESVWGGDGPVAPSVIA